MRPRCSSGHDPVELPLACVLARFAERLALALTIRPTRPRWQAKSNIFGGWDHHVGDHPALEARHPIGAARGPARRRSHCRLRRSTPAPRRTRTTPVQLGPSQSPDTHPATVHCLLFHGHGQMSLPARRCAACARHRTSGPVSKVLLQRRHLLSGPRCHGPKWRHCRLELASCFASARDGSYASSTARAAT
jgi:hypothetical protein